MKKNFLAGSLSGGFQIIVFSVLLVVSIPIFINKLGFVNYGVFSILMIVGNLNTFVNLGLNSTLIKYLSEQGKTLQSNFDIFASIVLISIILIPISIVGLFFSTAILVDLLHIPQDANFHFVELLFIELLISNIFIIIGQVLAAVLDSLQLVYLNNILQIFYNLIYWGGIIVVAFVVPRMDYIGHAILLASALWFVSLLFFVKYHWGSFSLTGIKQNFFRTVKKQLTYSIHLYLSGSISFFFEPFSKILISHFIGISQVGYYDLAIKLRNQIWLLTSKIFQPFFPLIANTADIEKIRLYVHKLEKMSAYILMPIIVPTLFLIDTLIFLWLGSGKEIISNATIILVSAFTFAILVIPAYQFLMAKGHPQKTVILQLINILVNATAFFVLYPFIGFYAIIIGNSLAILGSFSLTLYYQHLLLHVSIFDSTKQLLLLLLSTFICLISGFLLYFSISNFMVKLSLIPATIVILALFCYRVFKLITEDDISFFFKVNSTGYRFIKKMCISE